MQHLLLRDGLDFEIIYLGARVAIKIESLDNPPTCCLHSNITYTK